VTPPRQAESPALEDKAFLVLLVAVTLAFAWIVSPFFGAVLWGVILPIVFAPLSRRQLRSMRQRRAPVAPPALEPGLS
jgi:predicted PurR-regulated permease PerM